MKFMQHKKINFVICTGDYTDKIGGVISCNMLADILYIFSQNVFLYGGKPYPNSPITSIPQHENIWNFLEKEKTVVVYPETVNDNPLNSIYIARWLLNTPGIFSKSKTYKPFGEHFIYSNQFESAKQNLNSIQLIQKNI